MLVYVALAAAVALVLRRGDGPAVAGGALVGIVAVSAWGLGTRLFPDRFDSFDDEFNTYRLAEPLGYWNATGLLATLGVLLALGFAAHARRGSTALARRPGLCGTPLAPAQHRAPLRLTQPGDCGPEPGDASLPPSPADRRPLP